MNNNTCATCFYWRFKASGENDAIGICDNHTVIAQVTTMSESTLVNFVLGENDKQKNQHARFIANSMRFNGNFGCIHHKASDNE